MIKLPIIIQQEIKSYGKYSLPLCIVFSEEKYLPWIYKEFIQIKSLKVPTSIGNQLQYDSLINERSFYLGKFHEVLKMFFVHYSYEMKPCEVLSLVKEKLIEGNYVYVDLDEYYLSKKKCYLKEHITHPSLLYGFDEVNNIFNAVGYINDVDFSDYLITYEEVYKGLTGAIKENIINNSHGIYILKLKPCKCVYPYLINDFLDIIEDYLIPRKSKNFLYGFEIYDAILKNLENPASKDCLIKYNTLHLLYEHKLLFLKSLKYILGKYQFSNEILCQKYKNLVNMFNNIRLIYLRNTLLDSGDYKQELSEQTIADKIHDKIFSAASYEKNILYDIKNELSSLLQM